MLALTPAKAEVRPRKVRIEYRFEYQMHTHTDNPIHDHRDPQLPHLGVPSFGMSARLAGLNR